MANNLPTEKKTMAVSLLAEGSSIRSIERITGIHRDTIMRLGVNIGQACHRLHRQKMQNLQRSHREGANDKGERFVAVLEIPPVESAETAVRASIMADLKR